MKSKTLRPDLKMGDEVYRKGSLAPLYIVGETHISWLVKPQGAPEWMKPLKMRKHGGDPQWITKQQWVDWVFSTKHGYEVAREVETYCEPSVLRQVANLLGWVPCECGHGPRWHMDRANRCQESRCICLHYVPDPQFKA